MNLWQAMCYLMALFLEGRLLIKDANLDEQRQLDHAMRQIDKYLNHGNDRK